MHNDFKDKVLQATDIVEVIGEYISLTRRGKEYLGLCPFHADSKPSLNVSPTKQIFKCFACGAGGDAIKFVQMHEKTDFRTALATLAERAGITLHVSDGQRQADEVRDQIRQVMVWAATHFQRNLRETSGGKRAAEYALGRGLTAETIERHGLGYAADAWDDLLSAGRRAGLSAEVLQQAGLITTNENEKTYDRFRHRLMFPINDARGRCVAFGGRTLGDDPAKYLNSPETSLFSKSRILYGLDLARRSVDECRTAVVVEGYTDAVLLHQFGFSHVVATLGTALTDSHVKLLRRLAERLVLCFDGDQAGMRAADRAVEVSLVGGMAVEVAVLETGVDPADCVLKSGAAGFEQVLASSIDALQFKWNQTVKAFEHGGPGSRRAAIEALLEFVSSLTSAGGIDLLEQGLLVRRLSELLALPPESVLEMVIAARRRPHALSAESPDFAAEPVYTAAIRGLPVGLVAAVEDCLGLLMAEPRCMELIDDQFVAAIESCGVWRRLYTVIQDVLEEQGDYEKADIIARCDDADVCELASRSCARVADGVAPRDLFVSALDRLRSELNTQRRGELREALCQSDPAAGREADVFGDLLELARGQHFALAAEKRWSAKSAS